MVLQDLHTASRTPQEPVTVLLAGRAKSSENGKEAAGEPATRCASRSRASLRTRRAGTPVERKINAVAQINLDPLTIFRTGSYR